jgi:hypothetical protein
MDTPTAQHNPFAAPTAPLTDADLDAEQTRREHLNAEASIKSVGSLYMLTAILIVVGIIFLYAQLGNGVRTAASTAYLQQSVPLLAMSGFFAWLALSLRRLKPWSRVVGTVFSVIGLIGFPIGTLINGYILYLFWSEKGRMIFSEEYKEVIATTPHIKYKTSILVKLILALLVGGVGFIVVMSYVA